MLRLKENSLQVVRATFIFLFLGSHLLEDKVIAQYLIYAGHIQYLKAYIAGHISTYSPFLFPL